MDKKKHIMELIDIKEIKELPKGLKEKEHDGSFVLAYGEATGHHHKITAERMKIYEDEEGRFYMKIEQPAKLTHQEHKTLEIEKGVYIVEKEREYDYFSKKTRRVID